MAQELTFSQIHLIKKLNIETRNMNNGSVQVFNMSGQEVHRGSFENSNTYIWSVPTEIPNGLYLIKVSDENESTIKRAVLSH